MRVLFCVPLLILAGASRAALFLVNSPAPYLRANGETPYTPRALNLPANGFLPGQTVLLSRLGQYNSNASPAFAYGLSAVFSATATILPSPALHRIPGAIAAGPGWTSPNTQIGGLTTDIAEDFEVASFSGSSNGILLTIPAGAQYIFAAAEDDFFSDNNNAPELYLAITPVPESATLVPLALGTVVGASKTQAAMLLSCPRITVRSRSCSTRTSEAISTARKDSFANDSPLRP